MKPNHVIAGTRAAKEIPAGAGPIEQIVLPVEGTDREFVAQQWAVEVAASLGVGVRALHIMAPDERSRDDYFRFLARECREWGVPLETRIVAAGDPVDEILAELAPRDLVVIGTRKMAHQYHLGSTAADLVRRAPCPVQVVRIQ